MQPHGKIPKLKLLRSADISPRFANQAEERDWIFKTFSSYGGNRHLLWIGSSDIANKILISIGAAANQFLILAWDTLRKLMHIAVKILSPSIISKSVIRQINGTIGTTEKKVLVEFLPINGVVETIRKTRGTLINSTPPASKHPLCRCAAKNPDIVITTAAEHRIAVVDFSVGFSDEKPTTNLF